MKELYRFRQFLTEGDSENPILDKYLKLKKSIDYKTVFPTDLQSFVDSLDNTEREGLENDLAEGKLLKESFNSFLDTEEGGYMREYIDDVVEDRMGEPESLDLEYHSDFDIAFDLALTKLKKDQPQLDFAAIEANKESFF